MKKIFLFIITIIISVFSYTCLAEETMDGNISFVQIEEKRFYLQKNYREEVEAFLGVPSAIKFFKHGGEGFYWTDFTVCSYENGMLSFHYNKDGQIIRITINSEYEKRIQLPEGSLENLDFDDILMLPNAQTDIKDLYVANAFISFVKQTISGDVIQYSYWFNDESKIKWYDFYFERPWQ